MRQWRKDPENRKRAKAASRKSYEKYRHEYNDRYRESKRKWASDHKDWTRNYRRRKAGIILPAHSEPAACEVCGKAEFGHFTALVPDHSHATGKPRGWLCHKCNRALGVFGDELAGIERMRNYLLKYQFAEKP
jgi:hypothetical protein